MSGEVSDAALAAHFGAADVYVSLSVHEGFGVPLLEAMGPGCRWWPSAPGPWRTPWAAPGWCSPPAEPSYVAAAVHRVLHRRALRATLPPAGRAPGGRALRGRRGRPHVGR